MDLVLVVLDIVDNPEIKEILQSHGHLVCDVSSPSSIAEKIVEILEGCDIKPKKSILTSEAAAIQMINIAKIIYSS